LPELHLCRYANIIKVGFRKFYENKLRIGDGMNIEMGNVTFPSILDDENISYLEI